MSSAESPSAESPEYSHRRERATIAAQACETCRARKSRCNEQRPSCSLCQRLNLECKYRVPRPTKKDKTQELILQLLEKLNTKVDAIDLSVAPKQLVSECLALGPTAPLLINNPELLGGPKPPKSAEVFLHQGVAHSSAPPRGAARPYKVILWPFVRSRLQAAGVDNLDEVTDAIVKGRPWLLQHEFSMLTEHVASSPVLPMQQTLPSVNAGGLQHFSGPFPDLTEDNLVALTNAYFDTYNILFPIFEWKEFMEIRLPGVISRGFRCDDPDATIVLGIAALGRMAYEGVLGQKVSNEAAQEGLSSGPLSVPGAIIFNAFQTRAGHLATGCAIENIQAFLLRSLYCGACARYIDAWRSVSSASHAVQMLVSCTNIEWTSVAGMAVNRSYWICFLLETWYLMDLDLPRIVMYESELTVPLPRSELAPYSPEEQVNSAFLAANVSLCQLSADVQGVLSAAFVGIVGDPEPLTDIQIRQMHDAAYRLQVWRAELPAQLQWTDQERFAHGGNGPLPQASRFTMTSVEPFETQDRWCIATAQLRTKFYFIRGWIFHPYIYQALHLPERIRLGGSDEIAQCLLDTLLAPVAMYPCRLQKCLIPDLFSRSSSFLENLLILKMVTESRELCAIARDRLNEEEFTGSIRMYLHWLEDTKGIDSIAAWSWEVTRKLYGTFEA